MQNLEQIRARNALKLGIVKGDKGGEVIKKVPSLILNHGLLATAAFSFSEKEGWEKVFNAIAAHLADPEIAILPANCTDRVVLMKQLTAVETTSETLKLATAETMAWLAFATRFTKKV